MVQWPRTEIADSSTGGNCGGSSENPGTNLELYTTTTCTGKFTQQPIANYMFEKNNNHSTKIYLQVHFNCFYMTLAREAD